MSDGFDKINPQNQGWGEQYNNAEQTAAENSAESPAPQREIQQPLQNAQTVQSESNAGENTQSSAEFNAVSGTSENTQNYSESGAESETQSNTDSKMRSETPSNAEMNIQASPFAQPNGGDSASPFAQPNSGDSENPFAQPNGGDSASPFAQPNSSASTSPFAQPNSGVSASPFAQPNSSASASPFAQPNSVASTGTFAQPNSGGNSVNPYDNTPRFYPARQADIPPYNPNDFVPNQSKKKRVPVGLIIFFACATVVLGVCIFLTAYSTMSSSVPTSRDDTSSSSPFGDYNPFANDHDKKDSSSTDDSQDAIDQSELIDTTDKNAKKIEFEKQPSDIFESDKYTAKYAYDKSMSSVVGVICYNDKEKTGIGSQGTGIVITSDGYIVTNSHVIGDSKTKYKVVVSINGDEFDAQVTGFDSRTDIAVLKIDKTGLTPASFADSAEVQVGQEVVAIGNPGGVNFSNSLTQGIVSALDRDVSHGNVSYIQTDAAINPGNSGGPLLNMSGQVIGITTVKIVNTSYEGMGFAIPSQQAVSVIDSIMTQGYVEGRVRIGLTGNEINASYASYYECPVGILVATVDENGPLADGDIYPDDIITKIDDVEITSFSVLYKELDKHKAGDTVTLTYCCPNDNYETEYTTDVVLQADTE